jgi:hypothetical protein
MVECLVIGFPRTYSRFKSALEQNKFCATLKALGMPHWPIFHPIAAALRHSLSFFIRAALTEPVA